MPQTTLAFRDIKTIELAITLPVQQLEILPKLRVETANICRVSWHDINLFLLRRNGLSCKDHLVGIQNYSTIVVRKKASESKEIKIRVIVSTNTDMMKLTVDQEDFIWEVKYRSTYLAFSYVRIIVNLGIYSISKG